MGKIQERMQAVLKAWRGPRFRRETLLFALVLLCAAVCLAVGFSRAASLYPVDFGQYDHVLSQCGLAWTEEDLAQGGLQYERPVTAFAYRHFSWSTLLTPKAGMSIVYPIALVRLFTEPFGLPFSVDALAAVQGALLTLSMAVLAVGLARRFPRLWMAPVFGFMLLVLTDGNFCALLRGLYPQGSAAVFTVMFLTAFIRAALAPAEERKKWILPVLLCSLLLLKAMTGMLVFLPFLLAADLWVLFSALRHVRRPAMVGAACLIVLLSFTVSALQEAQQDADFHSPAAKYETLFTTILTKAEDPSAILQELGLDDSYLDDIGKAYYAAEDSFIHPPRSEEGQEMLNGLSSWRIAFSCLRRPGLFLKILNTFPYSTAGGYESIRNKPLPDAGGVARKTGGFFTALLHALLSPAYGVFALILLELIAVLAVFAFRKKRKTVLLACLFLLGCLCYLPGTVLFSGESNGGQAILYQTFLQDILLLTGVSCAIPGYFRLRAWLTEFMAEGQRAPLPKPCPPLLPAYTPGEKTKGWQAVRWLRKLAENRRLTAALCGFVGLAMVLFTFLPAAHPVSINNGDFGRMMEQMGLMWNGSVYYDTEGQLGRKAIEEFTFIASFDPLKLTPLKPTYSLYWFVSIVRLLMLPFGGGFSTYVLALVMSVVTVLCVMKLTYDLFPLLRGWTLATGLTLDALLLSQTYLTWYNSLYGEACILIGIVMTLTCAVHLCLMPRTQSWKKLPWLAGLALSLYILITAKAQMVTALPGAVLLLAALVWYQRPYRYDLMTLEGLLALALCAVLIVGSLGTYQSDRRTDSTSQKHTMWQAYFYGIFMISDDPIADMEALGVDTAMAPDIGKYVDFSNDTYVYAPLSQEAEAAFYDHVSTGTIIKWYLTHPAKLWRMIDYAASVSQSLYTGFRIYNGQDYSLPDQDPVDGLNLWPGWREALTPSRFIGYVLIYGALLFFLLRRFFDRKRSLADRILCCVPLFLMVTGVLQYPLSVLGNGFADNQKQLFCFSLCHDFLLSGALLTGLRFLAQGKLSFAMPGQGKVRADTEEKKSRSLNWQALPQAVKKIRSPFHRVRKEEKKEP